MLAIPFNYEERGPEVAVMEYDSPTVSLTVNFYEKVKAVEWLLTKTHMKRLHNGQCDMDVQVIDDDGKILASSTHVVALIPKTKRLKKPNASL